MNILNGHEGLYVDVIKETVNMIPVKGGEILIHIPIDTLYYAENHREYFPLKIHSKKKMINYIVEYILEWGGDDNIGSTEFEDFLDNMFVDALENGEEWLDADEEEE